MKKVNCWEFKRCERTPGGKKEEELGVCPVTMEKRLDDVHGGLNAGRACWVVAEAHCGNAFNARPVPPFVASQQKRRRCLARKCSGLNGAFAID